MLIFASVEVTKRTAMSDVAQWQRESINRFSHPTGLTDWVVQTNLRCRDY